MGERGIWHKVQQQRFQNPDAEGWEIFQRELVRERRMLKECGEMLVCMKCTWAIVWLFDISPSPPPVLSSCCNEGLNRPFPSPAINTIVHSALCWTEVREMICVWGQEGGSPVKMSLSILDLVQRGTVQTRAKLVAVDWGSEIMTKCDE